MMRGEAPIVQPKPAKGSALLQRKDARKQLVAKEDAIKRQVRLEDKRCRWPFCEVCKRYKDLALEVAHVIQAKGMSGDRTLERSSADKLMLLDVITHGQQERHEKVVLSRTSAGTRGPCEFWERDEQGRLQLVAREIAPFIYER